MELHDSHFSGKGATRSAIWTLAEAAHGRACHEAYARAHAACDNGEELALLALNDAWAARAGCALIAGLMPEARFELPKVRR